jgi:hypothetical protein
VLGGLEVVNGKGNVAEAVDCGGGLVHARNMAPAAVELQ